jgi:hypothetical protein
MASPPYHVSCKICQAVQKISIDPLYLKPAIPLGHFGPTVNNLVIIVTMVAYSKQLGCNGYLLLLLLSLPHDASRR